MVNQVMIMQGDAEKSKEENLMLVQRVEEVETLIEEEQNQSSILKLEVEKKGQENERVLEENVLDDPVGHRLQLLWPRPASPLAALQEGVHLLRPPHACIRPRGRSF